MNRLSVLGRELRAVWMLLGVALILFIASPFFLTSSNLMAIVMAASVTALLAIGQTFVIILGEIDLSVGAMLGFSAVITAKVLPGAGLVVALLAGVAAGVVAGLVNGLLVTKVNMPSFIATLATMSMLSGLTLYLTQGNPVGVGSDAFRAIGQGHILGVPAPIWILLVCAVVFGILSGTQQVRSPGLCDGRQLRGGPPVGHAGHPGQGGGVRHRGRPRSDRRLHPHRTPRDRAADGRQGARADRHRRGHHRRHEPHRWPRRRRGHRHRCAPARHHRQRPEPAQRVAVPAGRRQGSGHPLRRLHRPQHRPDPQHRPVRTTHLAAVGPRLPRTRSRPGDDTAPPHPDLTAPPHRKAPPCASSPSSPSPWPRRPPSRWRPATAAAPRPRREPARPRPRRW